MKQFIYIDNDIINSIIAQKDNGLIKDIKTESSECSEQKNKNTMESDFEGKLGGSLLKLATVESNVHLGAKLDKENNNSNTIRKIMEKSLHDAAFDMAYDYIKAEKIGINNKSCDEYGKYIELDRVFSFVDFDYLEGVFSKKGLIEFFKKSTDEEIRKTVETTSTTLNREQRREIKNQTEHEIKKAIEEKNKEYDSVCDIINAFRKMIPYNRMLISNDGYLIPLDEKYFRVNPTSIGFMYGGTITCVGMITNIIGKDTNPEDDKNVFANLQFSVNEVLRSVLPTKEENICVIHPIAVYYNN